MYEQSPLDVMIDERVPQGLGGRWYGVYPAQVREIVDPEDMGRAKVSLPWCADGGDQQYEVWARVATMMAGNNRGSWFMPDVDDEVLVVFEAGDPTRPYIIGALWNGQDAPPVSMEEANNVKTLRSRNGVQVTLNDEDGQETLKLETPGGHTITMTDGETAIRLEDSNGNTIRMESSGITIDASGTTIELNTGGVTITASRVTVNAGTSVFNGLLRANTVQTDTIIAATYVPGAGNVW
jgi:uncharacterized protein involved in type VI secretion and phage assembly